MSVTGDYQAWTTYRLIGGRFTVVELYELERLDDGVHAIRTISAVKKGRARVLSRQRVKEGW